MKREFYEKISWWIPKKLVYFCLIRGWANATTGEYSNTDAVGISTNEMIKRWDK